MKKKLAIITTHPIQYNAPLFELLTQRNIIDIKVFYSWGETVLSNKFDPGFGKVIEWDIPLLKGYNYTFLENTAVDKGSHHFNGIVNPGIIAAIEGYKADAVLVYGWSFKSHLKVLRYFKNKIPVLFRGDSTLLNKTGFIPSLTRNIILRWVYRNIDIALYVGTNNYDYFVKAGIKKEQLIYAPHVIDNERFAAKTSSCKIRAERFRKELGIKDGDIVLLFAGKLEPVKNPFVMLTAFIQCEFAANVHLVVVGNGVLENELKRQFQRENIHFMDFQNQLQMPAVYEMADVFILPSKSETWGLSVNEAMASGKAIVVSDKCGCANDLVENGVNGYIFNSINVDDLQEKLRKICEKREIMELMKEQSQSKIRQFSLAELALNIEKAIINK